MHHVRWRRCCHLQVSIIRVRYVASGMYVMNSTKNVKTIIGFKLNDGNVFPAQFHAVFLIQARGKCCKSLLQAQYETQYTTWKLNMELKLQLGSGIAYRKPKARLQSYHVTMQIEQRSVEKSTSWSEDVHLLSRLWYRNFAQTFQQGISMRFTEELLQTARKHFSHLHCYEMVLRYILREKRN